jgi:hypothetical protein
MVELGFSRTFSLAASFINSSLAKDKIFNGRLIIECVRIVTSILIVEWEVGPQVPPLVVEVVAAEPIVVAIVDEVGFFPCLEIIIA